MKKKRRRNALRPDTALCPAGEPENEIYAHELPVCCLRSLKAGVLEQRDGRRRLELDCSCGRNWWVTSSLDEKILARFVTHSGPRVGGTGGGLPAA